MVDVLPFRGVRFDEARLGRGLSAVITPPYDVISPDERDAFFARDPHNMVRLILARPDAGAGSDNPHLSAAAAARDWRASGVLKTDVEAGMYLLEQEFSASGARFHRRAVLALVGIDAGGRSGFVPHEQTLAKPIEDRLQLLRTCRASFEPIFCLYRDRELAVETLLWGSSPAEIARFTSPDGVQTRVLRVTDRELLASVSSFFRSERLIIADGHHRFTAACRYCDETGAARGAPSAFRLAALAALDTPGLVILPTHRVILRPGPAAAADPVGSLATLGHVERFSSAQSLLEALNDPAVCEPSRGAFGFFGNDGIARLVRINSDVAAQGAATAVDRLDVALVHRLVIEPLFGLTPELTRTGGHLAYVKQPEEAVAKVSDSRACAAILLRGTQVGAFAAVLDAGVLMPQKSTYFYPKIPSGAVMYFMDVPPEASGEA
ncbi:MAG: DUF1015 domain-containing protein [Candidatus Schekmanbacteria bacterium]|nr:DUF1015 domain-containing protein [Candidatus Schekmanbacteria bacterium]